MDETREYRLPGRPSKSLTLEQAIAVIAAAEPTPLHAYVTLSLLIGARTEEPRAGTTVTEKVYRHQLRPVLLGAATIMDRIFTEPDPER